MCMCVGLRRLSSVSTSDWITTISPHRLVYHPGLSNTGASMDFGCLLRSHFLLRNPLLLQYGLTGYGNTIFSSRCLSSSSSALRLFDFSSFSYPRRLATMLEVVKPRMPEQQEDRTQIIVATVVALWALSLIATGARFLGRLIGNTSLWWDDWLILCATVRIPTSAFVLCEEAPSC